MSTFIRKTIILLLTFFIFDKLFYVFLALSPSMEFDRRLEYTINGKMNKDLIILGSSRGARNVVAGQIEDKLGISSYNMSFPGSDIEFHEFLLNTVVHFNSPPKKVLLIVDESREFLPSKELVFRLDRLYPLAMYSYINNEMISRGEKSIVSKVLVLSRMNVRNFNLIKKRFSAIDSISECGSMPISYQKANQVLEFDSTERIYNPETELEYKINSFVKIQELCTRYDIELYVVFSPNYRAYNESFEQRIKELTNENVHFIHYDFLNPIYKDQAYYYDYIHLQKNGAIEFTNEIIDYLQDKRTTLY